MTRAVTIALVCLIGLGLGHAILGAALYLGGLQ